MHITRIGAALLLMAIGANAEVKMPAFFGDHMVLQQDTQLPVWGWAAPGEKVTVALAGQKAEAIAGTDGKWLAKLNPVKADSGGLELKVESSQGSRLAFADVLVGEVWLCSGQSNMRWPVSAAFNGKEESARANYPQIRLFKLAFKQAYEPQGDCEGKWEVCTPQTVQDFSAVGYYFGRDLHKALGCPVGLIQSAVGATSAQAWTSLEGLRAQPALKDFVDAFLKAQSQREQLEKEYAEKILPEWEQAYQQWEKTQLEPFREACRNWSEAAKQAKAAGQPEPPKPEMKQGAPGKPTCKAQNIAIPTLLYNAMIAPLAPLAMQGVIWYQGESNMDTPLLYRTLFAALISDWRRQWEQHGGQGTFAFLFAQLCSNAGDDMRFSLVREGQASALALPRTGMAVIFDCGEPEDPRIHPRNKRDVGLRLASVARHLIYGQDLAWTGPMFKSMQVEAGKIRVSFDHGEKGLIIGAPPQALEGQPAHVPDKTLNGFLIAGADRKFVPAQARIEGTSVVVWAEQVPQPEAVRYAWRSGPYDANLYNQEGWPAAPFRTDNWDR